MLSQQELTGFGADPECVIDRDFDSLPRVKRRRIFPRRFALFEANLCFDDSQNPNNMKHFHKYAITHSPIF
jgi:hypothetical protein